MYKVILVDDEPWILADLRGMVDWQAFGFQVVAEALSGSRGEMLIKACRPDLIISDIRMQETDGLEMFRNMGAAQRESSFTIFISAFEEFAYAREAIKLGAFDYIMKPIKQAELEDTLVRVKRRLDDRRAEQQAPAAALAGNPIISGMQKHIEQHYNSKLMIGHYAAEHYMNANYLSALFKQETRLSFTSYVLRVRMEKACQLLLTTHATIPEISVQVGYDDYVHFSKLFKKNIGVTPAAYRKMQQER